MNIGWLTLLLLLPLVGAIATMLVPKAKALLAKQVALGFSLVTLALTAVITIGYQRNGPADYDEVHNWIKPFGAHYALGLDGVGVVLVLLTALLTPVVLIASWNDAQNGRWSEKAFFAWILGLEALSLGVFAATDVFLFYVLFEATLIPMYFLIGGFGGPQRSYAAVKFLLYSLLGGLLMLASVVGLYVVSSRQGDPSYLLSDMMKLDMSQNTERWLFLGFFFAFAVKAPMVPFHTWLPDAAGEATPGTSVLLVGVLDKIGTFGMIRYCLGLFPNASEWATPVVLVLALISVLYGALLAIGQTDIRRLIAYTSISHFGFIVMGIFALTSQGLTGSTLYMFNHGLSTAALFLVAGYLIIPARIRPDRRLRRGGEGGAGAGRHVPVRRPGQPGTARSVAVHLRVHGAGRDVQPAQDDRGDRGVRYRARRAVHPADVPTHDDRTGPGRDREAEGPEHA